MEKLAMLKGFHFSLAHAWTFLSSSPSIVGVVPHTFQSLFWHAVVHYSLCCCSSVDVTRLTCVQNHTSNKVESSSIVSQVTCETLDKSCNL